jgi:hypothetical protein
MDAQKINAIGQIGQFGGETLLLDGLCRHNPARGLNTLKGSADPFNRNLNF